MAVRQMLVADRYRLLEPVGAGGMGRVWLARDEMLHRDVAVKEIVPPDWMTDDEQDRLRERTLREARSAARLNHPHVVRIYDVVHAEGLSWIVMEYVQSRSLHQVLNEDGPYGPAVAARIGLAVLDALAAAHRAGVLHRDVKPHNVLIGVDGRVVLTDFGLATFVDDGSVTMPGLIVGSPQYVSPERARDGASTVESDLWSLGATLYAAVEGRSPYARESAMATLAALATERPDPPVRAGPLTPVLAGLLRYDPATRLTVPEIERRLRMIVSSDPREIPFLPSQRDTRRTRPEEPRRTADPAVRSHRSGPAPATGGPGPAREGVVPAASGGSGTGETAQPGRPTRGTAAVGDRPSPRLRQSPSSSPSPLSSSSPPSPPPGPDRGSSPGQHVDRPRPAASSERERASPRPFPRPASRSENEEERPSPRPFRRAGRSTASPDRSGSATGSPASGSASPGSGSPGSGSSGLSSSGSGSSGSGRSPDAGRAGPGSEGSAKRPEPDGEPDDVVSSSSAVVLPGTALERIGPVHGARPSPASTEMSGQEQQPVEDGDASLSDKAHHIGSTGSPAFMDCAGETPTAGTLAFQDTSDARADGEDTDPLPVASVAPESPEEPETTRLSRPAGQALVPVTSAVSTTDPGGRWHRFWMSRRSASVRLTQARLAVTALVVLVIGGSLLAAYAAEVNRPGPRVIVPSPLSTRPSEERSVPPTAGPIPTPPSSGQTGPAGAAGPSAGAAGSLGSGGQPAGPAGLPAGSAGPHVGSAGQPAGSAGFPAGSAGSSAVTGPGGGSGRPGGPGTSPENPSGALPSAMSASGPVVTPTSAPVPGAPAPGVTSTEFSPTLCESPAPTGLPVTPLKGAPRGVNGWTLQPGWSYFNDGAGFHIAVPDGWTYQRIGSTYCFRSPRNVKVMSLDTARDPAVDPLVASRAEERHLAASGDLPGYALIGIASVPLLHKAADWEYRYRSRNSAARHASVRWFVIDGRAYALGWSTPEKNWNPDLSKIQMIRSTFYTNRSTSR